MKGNHADFKPALYCQIWGYMQMKSNELLFWFACTQPLPTHLFVKSFQWVSQRLFVSE